MLLEEQDDFASSSSSSSSALNHAPHSEGSKGGNGPPGAVHRVVHFRGSPLKLETRWGVGIGGDIWTTASLLCRFLEEHHAFFARVFDGARILEIGSGTGLVGLCVASTHSGFHPREVVISDQNDHLGLIRRNARANGLRTDGDEDASGGGATTNPPSCPVDGFGRRRPRLRIHEFDWVSGAGVEGLGAGPFDVVLGTDVAYCEELWAPVVKALERVAGPPTLVLLGVTRTDTGPPFFRMLSDAGFDYCLLRTDEIEGQGASVASGFALLSVVRRRGTASGMKGQ